MRIKVYIVENVLELIFHTVLSSYILTGQVTIRGCVVSRPMTAFLVLDS